MKKYPIIFFAAIIAPLFTTAQLPALRIVEGTVLTVEPGMLIVPAKDKYKKITDSLNQNLKKSPTDMTSLFYRALLYYSYNQKMAEPAQRTDGTLENLTIAKNMIERAIAEKMTDHHAKILRAQIYAELCYRYSGDERWMFNATTIALRRKMFENYKAKTNTYYDALSQLYPDVAYIYERKKIKSNYPIN